MILYFHQVHIGFEQSCKTLSISTPLLAKPSSSPHPVVHPLPEQLNWRLCTILLPGWHVHVINEDDTLLAHRWAKHTFPPLV